MATPFGEPGATRVTGTRPSPRRPAGGSIRRPGDPASNSAFGTTRGTTRAWAAAHDTDMLKHLLIVPVAVVGGFLVATGWPAAPPRCGLC